MGTSSNIELGEGTLLFKGLIGDDIEIKSLKATDITVDEWDFSSTRFCFTSIPIYNPPEVTFSCTIPERQMIRFIFKTCGFWFGVRFLVKRRFNQAKAFMSRLFKKETKHG